MESTHPAEVQIQMKKGAAMNAAVIAFTMQGVTNVAYALTPIMRAVTFATVISGANE